MSGESLRERAETRALATIEHASAALCQLAEELHADPELSFAEHRSVRRILQVLETAGLSGEPGAYGLDTAFEVAAGSGTFEVVICAEYDALPSIGHACGHNLIAAASTGAMLALAPLADELGIRVVLLGTPAEEHGAGKQLLLERGAWARSSCSLMVHPNAGRDYWPDAVERSCVHRLRATYRGRASHAAAAPEGGVNAADAVTVTQVALGLLRQQTADGLRFSALPRDIGEATNIIPDSAVLDLEVRGPDAVTEAELEQRIRACVEAGAIATGCTVHIEELEPLYREVVADPVMVSSFGAAMQRIGRTVSPDDPRVGGGSTDMGNVSLAVPSVHPTVAVLGTDAALHTVAFAAAAVGESAMTAMLDAARAMALTVIDIAVSEEKQRRITEAGAALRAASQALPVMSRESRS